MFNFIYGTSGMIEAFKLISAIGKVITITGAVSIFALFELIWGLNKIEGKFVLAPVFITFVGIIVSCSFIFINSCNSVTVMLFSNRYWESYLYE